MKIIFQTGRYLLTLLVLIAFTLPLQAQNVVENESKQTIIEIKDGKVYLNGEEVAELDDPDSSVLFKREDKEIIEKMIAGRIKKFMSESSLVEQPFVKDPDTTVGKLVKAAGAEISSFVRFEVGEGIEKEDGAAEDEKDVGIEKGEEEVDED